MLRGHTAALAVLLLIATVTPQAAERVWFVPWKVLDPGMPADPALFVLYWIPASPDDLKRSDLVSSRALAIFESRCVAMHVVRIDDEERLASFGEPELPVALIADGEGEIARTNGALRLSDVEAMVRAEFDERERRAIKDLAVAQECARDGDEDRARSLYERVARQRCSFPRHAKTAERALKRLR